MDYIIVQQHMFHSVKWFKVSAPSHISDHSMVSCAYQMHCDIEDENKGDYSPFPDKFSWGNESKFREVGYYTETKTELKTL